MHRVGRSALYMRLTMAICGAGLSIHSGIKPFSTSSIQCVLPLSASGCMCIRNELGFGLTKSYMLLPPMHRQIDVRSSGRRGKA